MIFPIDWLFRFYAFNFQLCPVDSNSLESGSLNGLVHHLSLAIRVKETGRDWRTGPGFFYGMEIQDYLDAPRSRIFPK